MKRIGNVKAAEKTFELRITSLDLPVVGIIDLLADVDGKRTVIDFKTSSSAYQDHEVIAVRSANHLPTRRAYGGASGALRVRENQGAADRMALVHAHGRADGRVPGQGGSDRARNRIRPLLQAAGQVVLVVRLSPDVCRR